MLLCFRRRRQFFSSCILISVLISLATSLLLNPGKDRAWFDRKCNGNYRLCGARSSDVFGTPGAVYVSHTKVALYANKGIDSSDAESNRPPSSSVPASSNIEVTSPSLLPSESNQSRQISFQAPPSWETFKKAFQEQSQFRKLSRSPSTFVSRTTISDLVSSIVGSLRRLTNLASLLCVLDCTLLPLVTVFLPILGWAGEVAGGTSISSTSVVAYQHILESWSHNLSNYFVLPVGTLTTLINFSSHRNPWVASLGLAGVGMVGLANLHASIPSMESALAHLPALVTVTLSSLHHDPLWHRIFDLIGCAFLITSNFLAQRLGCNCGLPFCRPKNNFGEQFSSSSSLLAIPKVSSQISSLSPPASIMSKQMRMVQYRKQNQTTSQARKVSNVTADTLDADKSDAP